MIKNQLYPYIEEYINAFLYGFTKEQLDVGLMKGEIKLENLNLRPDGVNDELDQSNFPFWLKAGLISKINLCCSLMNFIGEKPIEANIEGINIILCPSYKWIIQNLDSFIYEDLNEMKSEYSSYENNSVNIFGKKINVLDNSIFNKHKFEKFFKDETVISRLLNKYLIDCFKFYYSKNYSLILKLKNIHIRFEDDQLINYMGNIAFGCKIDLFELTLSSEGTMKKNNFKITKLDFYWENNANILIPSNILYDSIKSGVLRDIYYTNLKKIKFENFSYKKDTKFIIQNLNCLCNFGTRSMDQGKLDLFGKKENNYKLYMQFASNEIKINFFPDLNIIRNNFRKFVREFTIIGQAQEFKPMKKPYNSKNRFFTEILKNIKINKNTQLAKKFPYKRKMLVRDWLYYFFWCYKCKSSIYSYDLNPLRLEFTRFYNLFCKEREIDKLNDVESEKEKIKKSKLKDENTKSIWSKEKPNPDNINLLYTADIKIKGINLNLYPFISSKDNNEFISIKISNLDCKISLNKEKFDLLFTIKNIILGPNKLNSGEKVIISNNSTKKRDLDLNSTNIPNERNNNINYGNYLTSNDIDSNTGINGLLKKYNPNYTQQLNIIDKAMKKLNRTNTNEGISDNNKEENANNKNDLKGTKNNNYQKINNNSFSKNIINNYDPTPSFEKMELKKQKNEFNISQAINQYNNNKSFQRSNTPKKDENERHNSQQSNNSFNFNNNARITKNQSSLIPTGKVTLLNLIELYSDNNNANNPCVQFKYSKINNNSSSDMVKIIFGIIRINLFSEYILKCENILNDYRFSNRKVKIKSIKNDTSSKNDITIEYKLLEMRKYFLEQLNKIPENKRTGQINSYIAYLQNEINNKNISFESDNYELNCLFSIFSKGVDITIDYDNLECIYYSNKNNKICGKAIMPSPMFNFKVNPSNISFKLYDFELEIDDLDNAKLLFKALHSILEDKFKMTQLLIEPCMSQIKKEIEMRESRMKKGVIKKNNNNINKVITNNLNTNIKNSYNTEPNKNPIKDEKEKENKENIINDEKENKSNYKKIMKKEKTVNHNNINKKIGTITNSERNKDNNNNINIIQQNEESANIINSINASNEVKLINNNQPNKKKIINKINNNNINISNNKLKYKTISIPNENKNRNKTVNKSLNSNNLNIHKNPKNVNNLNNINNTNNINNSNNQNSLNNLNQNIKTEEKIENNIVQKKDSKLNLSKNSSKNKIVEHEQNKEITTSNKNPPIPNKKVVKGKKQIVKKKINLNPKKE